MAVRIRAPLLAALALVVTTALAGAQPAAGGDGAAEPPEGSASPAVDAFRSVRTYDEVSVPVRLRIPAVGIDTSLQPLHRTADGQIAVPDRPEVAGWYAEGARPGQPGSAVILGHVDSTEGPAVFFEVARLPSGTAIYVDRADGSTVGFRVGPEDPVPDRPGVHVDTGTVAAPGDLRRQLRLRRAELPGQRHRLRGATLTRSIRLPAGGSCW
jgi:Sortase domain